MTIGKNFQSPPVRAAFAHAVRPLSPVHLTALFPPAQGASRRRKKAGSVLFFSRRLAIL